MKLQIRTLKNSHYTKRYRLNLLAILIIILVQSCGKNSKNSIEVKPKSVEIEGYLSKYLEVVDGLYRIEKDNSVIFSWVIKVKVKAKEIYPDIDKDYGLRDGNHGPLYLDLYDDKGVPLIGFDNLLSDYTIDTKLTDILRKGNGEIWITLSKFHDYGKEEFPKNISTFSIGSRMIENSNDELSSSNKDLSNFNNIDIEGSEDYDQLLNDYEEYVETYLRLFEKANKGDMSALTEYPEFYERAENLSKSLEKAKGNMSIEQINRMLEIQTKMSKELLEKIPK